MSGLICCQVNGRSAEVVSVHSRALHYGDGLFETLRVHAGRPEYLARHLSRMRAGCERLGIGAVDWRQLDAQLKSTLGETPEGVLKIILVRGSSGRGYATSGNVRPDLVTCLYPPATDRSDHARKGVTLGICSTRLAHQPLLAGIKHLNRLEQVLARNEWQGAGPDEALLLDVAGRVVEGTMSNLFLVRDGQLLTPDLSLCGVSGILRSVLLDLAAANGLDSVVTTLSPADVLSADEVFVCNSLVGIWPVVSLAGQGEFQIGPLTRQFQAALRADEDDSDRWYPA